MSYRPGMMDKPATGGIGAVPVSIGVSFPESIMPGTPLPDIAGLAGLAERAGLDGVWVGDRLAAGELSVLDSGLHAAIGTGSGRDLAEMTAGIMQSMFGVLADRAREVAIAGTPTEVASQLAPHAEAGVDLIVVVCDPAPTPKSWELLADVRRLLTQ
jgi:alkanesulfonate monooxygenase SsuD/methylene tetrahydromethanopterin reductase-like flavin-dependent oxidoreductase (luciferase family)